MDDDATVFVAEDAFDFSRMVAEDAPYIIGMITHHAPGDLPAFAIVDADGVSSVERAMNFEDADGEQATPLLQKRVRSALIDGEVAGGGVSCQKPALAAFGAAGPGRDARPQLFSPGQPGKDVGHAA